MASDSPQHFVSLLGSLRAASFNRILERALPGLAPEGVTVEALGSVGDFPLYNADVQAGGFPAAVTAMGAAIRGSDGVIIVTPEYNYGIPGVLKNAIDWLSRLAEQPFAGKAVALISGSPGLLGGARAQYQLRQSMIFLDAHLLNKPEVMVAQITGKVDAASGELTDQGTRDFIAGQLKSFSIYARRVGA